MTRPLQSLTCILLITLVCLGAPAVTEPDSGSARRRPRSSVVQSDRSPGSDADDAIRRHPDIEVAVEGDGHDVVFDATEVDGVPCIAVDVPAGGTAKVSVPGTYNWTGAEALTVRARRMGDFTGPVQLIFFFQDVDFWWYQKLLRAEISSGDWTTIAVPLVPVAEDVGTKYAWESIGHAKPYDRAALRKARCVGLIVVPDSGRGAPAPARVLLAEPALLMPEIPASGPPTIYDLAAPRTARRYERFEAAFRLDRTYENPFDPDVIDVQATVTTPSGRQVPVFGFWSQDYTRRIVGRAEQLVPVGEPLWRVRFAPSELGTHTFTITARDTAGTRTTSARAFEVLDGPSDGFLRVSKDDHHYLEFDSGTPWWGIGLNLHCTYDYRYHSMVRNRDRLLETDRHSLFYDDRFKKLADNGMNWTELWIASWGFEIEWRGDWRGWAGTGHYGLENAWRLDRALEQCRNYGIYVNLVLTCHGIYRISANQVMTHNDNEFQHHPYYIKNGGWLTQDFHLLTDELAHDAMRKRLRYIIARYGHSTNIACWEMISESDLASRDRSAARPWIFKMADMVRTMDPYAHPITNHYCGNYNNVDPVCFNDPRIDLTASDAYRDGNPSGKWHLYFQPFASNIVRAAQHLAQFKKPAIITECGGQWFSGPKPLLEADIHALNWSSWMTTLAATPLTWWEDFVDEEDLYGHYAALARYVAGEDKRGLDFGTVELPTFDAAGARIPRLSTLALKNRTEGYAWISDEEYFEFGSTRVGSIYGGGDTDYSPMYHAQREVPIRTFQGARATITGLDDGTYDVEIWDCYTGLIISAPEVESDNGAIIVELPTFSQDIALKFRRKFY
ncbi:MAG: DUF5060 domain-containing protein [Verrucomicrobia bacterium]|nr:DUF5060 domain-containing protein [Verrucomicrobiota bacterium]